MGIRYNYSGNGAGWAALFVVLLWLAAAIGWVINIVKLIGSINDPVTVMHILRSVGIIFAPLGAVLGYL